MLTIALLFLIAHEISTYETSSYSCTDNDVKYQCGQWSPDGTVCNNLEMPSGNCLIIMCTTYNSCNCHVQSAWSCQMGSSKLVLHHNGTFSIDNNFTFV